MIWVYVVVGCVVWCIGAGVFYEDPGREDPVPMFLRCVLWPVWILPVVLFTVGQEVRRLLGRALDWRDARKAGKPRGF